MRPLFYALLVGLMAQRVFWALTLRQAQRGPQVQGRQEYLARTHHAPRDEEKVVIRHAHKHTDG